MSEHSVQVLAKACAIHATEFGSLASIAKVLDQYYIPTRYPDAIAPPALPFESYTQEQARYALDGAKRILDLADRLISA